MRFIRILLLGLLLAGCATTPKTAIFVGNPDDIEYEKSPQQIAAEKDCPPEKGCITIVGVALGRLDDIDVLETRGDRVHFVRYTGWHGPMYGWVNRADVAYKGDFKPVGTWTGQPELSLCDDYGCEHFDIASDGSFTTEYEDNCSLINVYGDCPYHCPYTGDYDSPDCRSKGRMLVYRDVYRVQHDGDYWDYMLAIPGQGICWEREWVEAKTCTGSVHWHASEFRPQSAAPGLMKIGPEALAASTADSAQAAGLTPLKDLEFESGQKEIRIWWGFGLLDDLRLVRLSIDAHGHATGGAFSTYNVYPDSSDPKEHAAHAYLEERRSYCPAIGDHGDREACAPKLDIPVDWSALYTTLVQDEVWTLPDSMSLPNYDVAVKDGIGMLVEVRDGAAYRAYAYPNPGYSHIKEGKEAAAIFAAISKIYRRGGLVP